MKRILLSLIVFLAASACAEEEMMRMALEARERMLAALKAKQIPNDIALTAANLTDNDVPTREKAAAALLEHSDRKSVIAAMIVAMKEDDNNKRPNAGTILVKTGADALGPLVEALDVNELRPRATLAISELGEAAKPAIPALIQLLKSDKPHAVADGAVALGVMGQNAKDALQPLIEALKNPDQEVRAAVATAIKQIGPAPEHVPLLVPHLQDPYMKVRSTITLTFGYMGDAGKPAIPEMIKHIKDSNSWVRMHTCASLARFGPDAKEAVPQLKEAMSDEVGVVRGNAAVALSKIAPSSDFVPDFIKLLQDANDGVRTKAEEAVVEVGKVALDDLSAAADATTDPALKTTLTELKRKIKSKAKQP
jgi:HEAT repeat protein